MNDDLPAQDCCNCLALRQAARHVSQIYASHLAAVGLRGTQYSLLAKIKRHGPLTINALAGLMVMERTALGRGLRPLERDGLIAVVAGSDARTRRLQLTASGEARLAAAIPHWHQAQQAVELALGADQAAEMRALMRRVVASV